MNLQEIRKKIRDIIREPDETGFYNNEEINDWINEGQREIAKKTNILKGTSYVNTYSGIKEYELPTDYLDTVFLQMNGEKLYTTSMEKAIEQKEKVSGYHYYYIWDNVLYLTFEPGDNELFLLYNKMPMDMTDDLDTPSIPFKHQDALVDYGVYKAKQTDRMFNEADIFKRDFQDKLRDIKYYSKEPSTKQFKVKRLWLNGKSQI